jgi:uncharacterized protein
MSGLTRREKELSQALLDIHDDAMLIEELDGFLAGLLVCPEMIPPSVWLPLVWNSEGAEAPAFQDLAHLNRVMGLVMDHNNRIATALFEKPDTYAPLFVTDRRNGDILWELWVEGFEKAVKLRPQSWQPLLGADLDTVRAWSGLMNLADIARNESSLSGTQIEALTATAPDDIAGWVLDLNAWRLANLAAPPGLQPTASPASSPRVGRNDPCPCGSGRKYKKCCGLN